MQNITFTKISVKEDGVQILEKDVVVQCALEMPGTLQHILRANQGSSPELAVLEPAGWNFGNFSMNHAFVYSKIIPSYLPMQIIKETLIVIQDFVELTCAMVDHTIPGELCQNCHQENCLTYFLQPIWLFVIIFHIVIHSAFLGKISGSCGNQWHLHNNDDNQDVRTSWAEAHCLGKYLQTQNCLIWRKKATKRSKDCLEVKM